MNISEQEQTIVEDVFTAMQRGADGEDLMMSLFNEDAVFTEPFTGEPRTHRGKDEIRTAYLESSKESPPGLSLQLDRLDRDEEGLRAEWTCTSAVFPTPMRGYDLFKLKNGRIESLEIVVTEMPDFGGGHP